MPKHWTYRRPKTDEIVETAHRSIECSLTQVGHFHSQTQLVIVHEGWRGYITLAGTFRVEAGQVLALPARLFHVPLELECVRSSVTNIYLPADRGAVGCISRAEILDLHKGVGDSNVIEFVADTLTKAADNERILRGLDWGRRVCDSNLPIRDIAENEGLSVDGFIRAFSKRVGATPGQYRIAYRLDAARGMLRQGDPAASVAGECGFADQSHLGRHFLRAFGTTLKRYQVGALPR